MKNRNIKYKTGNISTYYSSNRGNWDSLYQSGKKIIENLKLDSTSKILDIGCACGGLSRALNERFGIIDNIGLDINDDAIRIGIERYPNFRFINGDFLNDQIINSTTSHFDYIFSLSCFDWNLEHEAMFSKLWSVPPNNSTLIFSCRLSTEKTISDLSKSYQKISFEGIEEYEGELEVAPYIIFNAKEKFQKLLTLNFSELIVFGYMGKPSITVTTKKSEILFAVFSIRKQAEEREGAIIKIESPKKIIKSLYE